MRHIQKTKIVFKLKLFSGLYSSCVVCSIVNFNATVHSILCSAINKTKLKGYE